MTFTNTCDFDLPDRPDLDVRTKYVSMCVYVCVCVCMSVFMCICDVDVRTKYVSMCVCVCVCVCMSVFMCICVRVWVTHIFIYNTICSRWPTYTTWKHLVFKGYFPLKSPRISGSVAENDIHIHIWLWHTFIGYFSQKSPSNSGSFVENDIHIWFGHTYYFPQKSLRISGSFTENDIHVWLGHTRWARRCCTNSTLSISATPVARFMHVCM